MKSSTLNRMTVLEFATKSQETILTQLTSSLTGLSDEEARQRKTTYGGNDMQANETTWFDVLLRQFKSPFIYLLLGSAGLSFLLGEAVDGAMILLFVFINALLGFYQEYRSEMSIRLLRQFIVAKTTVIRSGRHTDIVRSDLVPGDIVLLSPGDKIPADVRFLTTEASLVDESILTGESAAVAKSADTLLAPVSQYYEATNIGFSGTTVTGGKATGIVVATGRASALGTIAKLTAETKHEGSFEKGIARFSTFVLRLILVTLVAIFGMNILLKGPDVHIPTLLVFGIALAVSVIPEALPVVTMFSLSRGALRLARHKVVVKRLSAIEDLGSIEVLCTDKTGTITENKLTVSGVFPENSNTLWYGALAAGQSLHHHQLTDSFDLAFSSALPKEKRESIHAVAFLDELPFDPERRRNAVVVKHENMRELVVRGAPETVLGLVREEPAGVREWLTHEGIAGKRVIAIAKRTLPAKHASDIRRMEQNLTFVGCVSFVDPLKKTTHEAVAKANALSITIKIITGDSREVAGAVASSIGLIKSPLDVLTGEEFDRLSTEDKHQAVETHNVFARVSPSQKHRIIELIREKHEVGFLGEGMNDAPALKAANVALVVPSASDIAKDAADIVLLHKSLLVIIDGIREGREIFANTTKYIKATLASNFGNFYTVAVASLFITFLPLLPLQILLINLLTDFPMIAIATDSVEEDELKRPKNYDIRGVALISIVFGMVSSVFDFIFFVLYYRVSPETLQTNWFIGSVLTELVFLYAIRTKKLAFLSAPPAPLLTVLTVLAFLTALILPMTPVGAALFSFKPPSAQMIAAILSITAAYFLTTEGVKFLYYRVNPGKSVT